MESELGVPLPRARGAARGWRHVLRRRLPLLRWLPQYSRVAALADLVAGVTLGLTLVPQSIAYASLANLPVQYGLYSSFVGTMLYVVLGTVKEVSIGPTSLMALFTLQICRGLPVEFVVLLTFLSGCVVLIMGLLRLEAEGRARALATRGACALAAVHQSQRARGVGRVFLRLPHAPPQPAAFQTIRARGAGPAAPVSAALQRRARQQHGDVRGHGAHAGLGRHHDAHRHGARQHRHRQGFLDWRAGGRNARDGDPRAVQHGRLAGARHAHVRRLHALRRVALQRRAHARRRPLLRHHHAAGADLPHAVLLLHPEGVSLLRAHLCCHIHDRFAHRVPAVAARPAGAGGAGTDVLRQHRAHRGASRAGRRAGLSGRAAAPAHAARRARARAQNVGGRRGARARGAGPGLRVGRAAGAACAGSGRARRAASRAAGLSAPRPVGLRRHEGAGTSDKEIQDGRAAADRVQRARGAAAQVRAVGGRGPAGPARRQRGRRTGQRGARRGRERHAACAHGARRARRARRAQPARVTARARLRAIEL